RRLRRPRAGAGRRVGAAFAGRLGQPGARNGTTHAKDAAARLPGGPDEGTRSVPGPAGPAPPTSVGAKVVDNLSGRTVLVTGASSGIGLAVARQLAAAGARTLLACRSDERAAAALATIRASVPAARAEYIHVDLSCLDSIEEAAAEIADRAGELDVLVNNAGVMTPTPGHTADGFELQIGTNHLGHFALTGHLLPLLLTAEQPRVVTVSSLAHRAAVRAELTDFKILPKSSN